MTVTTHDLCFSYRRREVLSGVTARFGPGINGVLGPNGAGKTTLLRIIAATAVPASGVVQYPGISGDPRSHIGFLPQHFEVLARQSVRRNVEYAAWARGVSAHRSEEFVGAALDATNLTQLSDRAAKSLSGGERQRLGIACATVHRPSVIVLDEPTVGLDPEQRIAFRGLIQQLGQMATVILSTHIVDDLTQLDTNVIVIADGMVRFEGSVDDIAGFGRSHPIEGMSPMEAGYVFTRSLTQVGVDR